VNLKEPTTVLYLNDNRHYALRYDPGQGKVVVDRYVSGNQQFKFDLERVISECDGKCDCDSSV